MARAKLEPGLTLDGFRLEECLHRGGMAEIWRVSRPDLEIPAVMKVPFLDFEGDLSLLVGFEVEQMIMAELTGPHVPRWIANGDFAVQPYIVMERIPGPTLLRRIQEGPAPPEEVFRIGVALAEAVGDLHRQRVLHLDLKPANVLFRPDGTAVLIDFGLSRHLDLPDLLEEQFGRPTGTPQYMAPEQYLRIRSDRRSDLFALGAILYELATGVPPFGIPMRMARVLDRVWSDPPPPRALRPSIPPALQEIILECLEPVPDRRYATAEELAFDLRHPDLVPLGERAARLQRSGLGGRLRRRLRLRRSLAAIRAAAFREPPQPPIVLVAVDLRPGLEELRHALLEAAAGALANTPGARLACLNVVQTSLVAIDENVDEAGQNIHVQRLAALRRWAEPLGLPRGKVTYHLVEAVDVAAGILDFARANRVAHLVIGAPSAAVTLASRLTAQITAEAPCPVTLVRAPGEAPAETHPVADGRPATSADGAR